MAQRELLVRIIGDNRSLSRALRGSTRDAKVFNAQISTIGRNFSRGLGLGAGVAGFASLGLAIRNTLSAAIDFEQSFAGVRKTVDATEPELLALSAGFRRMARELPVSVNELNRIGEAAGQLGIQKEAILGFTRTVADLGATTNLASEDAANALARIANITGLSQDQFGRLGATIVELGNKLAATEAEIVELSLRLAGAGNQIGLTEAQITAFAGALASVGINAESGGSAFSRTFALLATEVASGGKKLDEFARVAGVTSTEFRQAFERDAAGAVVAFVEGLSEIDKQGENVFAVLKNLGLGEVRVRDALLRAAGAGDLFRESLEIGSRAWRENTALTEEAAKRYATAGSRLQVFRNRVNDLQITLGEALVPALEDILAPLSEWLEDTKNQERLQRELAGAIATAGEVLRGFVAVMKTLRSVLRPVVEDLGGVKSAVKILVGLLIANKVLAFATAIRLLGTSSVTAAAGVSTLNARLATLRTLGVAGIVITVTLVGKEILDRLGKFAEEHGSTGVGRVATKGGVFGPGGLSRDAEVRAAAEAARRAAARTAAAIAAKSDIEDRRGELPGRSTDDVVKERTNTTKRTASLLGKDKDASKKAKDAADRAREAFERFLDSLHLGLERAQATARFDDDLVELQKIENALRARLKIEKNSVDLERQLFQVEQERIAVGERRREAQAALRDQRQFFALGLSPTGGERTPNIAGLRRQLGNFEDAVKGTFLDTKKTRSVIGTIRKLLAGGFGKMSETMRATVRDMLRDLNQQLKGFESGPRTLAKALDVSDALKGLTGDLARARNILTGATVVPRQAVAPSALPPGQRRLALAGGDTYIFNGDIVTPNPDAFMRELDKRKQRTSVGRR